MTENRDVRCMPVTASYTPHVRGKCGAMKYVDTAVSSHAAILPASTLTVPNHRDRAYERRMKIMAVGETDASSE